ILELKMDVVGHFMGNGVETVLIPHVGKTSRDLSRFEHGFLSLPAAVSVDEKDAFLLQRTMHLAKVFSEIFTSAKCPVTEVEGVDHVELAGTIGADVFAQKLHARGRLSQRLDIVLVAPSQSLFAEVHPCCCPILVTLHPC